MIEQERKGTRGDPAREAKMWLDKLEKLDRQRVRFQHTCAEEAIGLDDLRARLAELDDERKIVKRELDVFEGRRKHLQDLECNKDAILQSYADIAPEALDSITPEERHHLYKMLRLKMIAHPDKTLEVCGAFGNPKLGTPALRGCANRRVANVSTVE